MSRPLSSRDRPLVVAHRGASAHARDNSLQAFMLAAECGADGIEFDVRFTADREVIIHHDAAIAGFGALIDHRFATVRRQFAYIPRLDEIMACSMGMLLNIEI